MELALFLAGWLRSPRHIGAVAPSSGVLADTLAAQLHPPFDRYVIELGAGTGVTSRALLKRGLPPEHLIVVERDARFCDQLRHRLPGGVTVIRGDARRLNRILPASAVYAVDSVISSLPLLSLGPAAQLAILTHVAALLGKDGKLVQYTYGMSPPVHPDVLARLPLVPEKRVTVWRNLPPATVWCFSALRETPAPRSRKGGGAGQDLPHRPDRCRPGK